MLQPIRRHNSDTLALIGLGANEPAGDSAPAQTLVAALNMLPESRIEIDRISRLYRTPCFPVGAGPDYVNAAAALRVKIPPDALLARLHEIEASFGRTRQERWGNRVLDLDLLAFGDAVLPDPATQQHWRDLPPEDRRSRAPDQLIVPHPRLQDRAFVLIPLLDVAPDWHHPVMAQTVRQMCDDLTDDEIAGIVALDDT